MARTKMFKTKKSKIILSLFLACVIGVSLFFILRTSPEDNKNTSYNPNYSYSQTDNSLGELSNSSFSYGTIGAKYSSYPRTSVTGWKLTKNSSAKSGVVNVSDDAWNKLMTNFYSDPGMLGYVKALKKIYTADQLESLTKSHYGIEGQVSHEQVINYCSEVLFPEYFPNPGVHDKAHSQEKDNLVYMLNNYKTGELGSGSSQKLVSNREITLNKGEFAKVSVWVKTINIDQFASNPVGANITIENSFNGIAQAPFGYFNIDTKGKWENYTFYVQGDKTYTTKFTLNLGLGYGDDYSEGTAFFDDIIVEHLETLDKKLYDGNVTNFEFSSDKELYEAKTIVVNEKEVFPLYNLSLSLSDIKKTIEESDGKYFNPVNFASTGYTDDRGVSGNRFNGNEYPVTTSATINAMTKEQLAGAPASSGKALNLKYASYTLSTYTISLNPEEYAYVSFFIKNNLNTFYNTTITINVIDNFNDGTKDITVKRPTIAQISNADGEWINCGVLVSNNFDRKLYEGQARTFSIEIVVGPTDLMSTNITDYAYGDVYITDPQFATGKTYKYEDDVAEEKDETTENYDYYQFFSASPIGFTSLYAGYDKDYQPGQEDEKPSYSMTISPSAIGAIETRPATPTNYKGVTADHYYIKEGSINFEVDSNAKAGVVNTKYVGKYKNSVSTDIGEALLKVDDEDIQPLMIYNQDKSHYGYIGDTYSISASSYASISLNVRVYGGAKAYIYLVDVSKQNKSVMTFNDFTVNANTISSATPKGTKINGSDYKLELVVTEDMLDSNGWTKVTFYVAAGATPKTFRLEMWNGGRDNADETKSEGYTFFNDINISTSSAFAEPKKWQDAFTVSGNPLYDIGEEDLSQLIAYKRVLSKKEKEFNNDPETKASDKVSYNANYVWAKNNNIIYAVYNTLDPVAVDPYSNSSSNDSTSEESNTTDNSANFWLQLSSILLAVVLFLAIIALFIKGHLRKRKANKSDAKSHYKVVSRSKKTSKKSKEEFVEEDFDDYFEEEANEDVLTNVEELQEIEDDSIDEQAEPDEEQTLDSYVYGDVQNFGDDLEQNNEEQTSEDSEN